MKWQDIKSAVFATGSLIISLIGLVFFFKNKADKSETQAILGETRGQDKELKKKQQDIKQQIKDVKDSDDKDLTPEERAKRWEK